MQFQVLVDKVAKAMLIKAGTLDKMTKEKVQLIFVIISGIQIIWTSIIFKTLSEMVQKKRSTGFAIQISKYSKMIFSLY